MQNQNLAVDSGSRCQEKRGGKLYTLGEEIFNSVSHGVGTLLAIAGAVILIVFAALQGDGLAVVAVSIYSATMILLYTMSTLYHSFTNQRVKAVFRIFDHCSIFLLIAGTYTPLALIALSGKLGTGICIAIWATAIFGIILNAISIERFKKVSMICYLAMGWCAVLIMKPLVAALPVGGLWLLIGGGVVYTLGIIFYALHRYLYMHSIWHLFVLGGSVLHYFCILLYVLPLSY